MILEKKAEWTITIIFLNYTLFNKLNLISIYDYSREGKKYIFPPCLVSVLLCGGLAKQCKDIQEIIHPPNDVFNWKINEPIGF